MKEAKPILGKLSNAMLDALIAISSRAVWLNRGRGLVTCYSFVEEDDQVSVIKPATIDALIKRNLVCVAEGHWSRRRLELAKGVAEHLPLGVGLR